jgi:regulator of protease activity HflC (stomatin/prohibitin superfamily)
VNGSLIFAIAFLAFGLSVASKSLVSVPEGSAFVVESLGRYAKTLGPGVHVLRPFVEVVRFRHSLAEQSVPLGAVAARTKDDREVFVEGSLAYRITDAERASYAVADLRQGLTGVTQHAIREAVSGVPLDELHASRASVEAAVLRGLAPTATGWGVEPLRHEITDISRLRKESHT